MVWLVIAGLDATEPFSSSQWCRLAHARPSGSPVSISCRSNLSIHRDGMLHSAIYYRRLMNISLTVHRAVTLIKRTRSSQTLRPLGSPITESVYCLQRSTGWTTDANVSGPSSGSNPFKLCTFTAQTFMYLPTWVSISRGCLIHHAYNYVHTNTRISITYY